MPSDRRLAFAGLLVLAIIAAFALWAWAEDTAQAPPADKQATTPAGPAQPSAAGEEQPAPTEEQAPEEETGPIISSNGLELVRWYTTTGHELHILIRDLGTVHGNRQGTVSFTLTGDNGASKSGDKRFNCSPNDNYDRDIVLTHYKPHQRGQWAKAELTFKDNKGTSEFWFSVYLN
jgi:hypothetical protein